MDTEFSQCSSATPLRPGEPAGDPRPDAL